MIKTASSWQQELRHLITDIDDLCAQIQLSPEQLPALDTRPNFPLRVSRSFAQRIRPGDPNDPLLRQILPKKEEHHAQPGYTHDPLIERQSNPVPGLLHKYKSRVLVMLTSACAVHCRYCFRRHFPYEENCLGRSQWQGIYDYLHQHPEVNELILSGGDPLMVKDELLAEFIQGIRHINHIKRIRFHTRVPIMIPQRITPELCQLISDTRWQWIMVIHCNHANELNDEVKQHLQILQHHQLTLLNQSVLLKDVNDNATALINLSEHLFEAGVLPYYLHILDKVAGAHEFEVPLAHAQQLMTAMQLSLPGFLVPKLVREDPNYRHKVLL